jgi:hypothetical protein
VSTLAFGRSLLDFLAESVSKTFLVAVFSSTGSAAAAAVLEADLPTKGFEMMNFIPVCSTFKYSNQNMIEGQLNFVQSTYFF